VVRVKEVALRVCIVTFVASNAQALKDHLSDRGFPTN
jgi:hypothetical protein